MQVFYPALSTQEQWGELPREKAQSEFLQSVNRFISMLSDALLSMKDNVQLAKPQAKYVSDITNTPEAVRVAAEQRDLVESFEGTLCISYCTKLMKNRHSSQLV